MPDILKKYIAICLLVIIAYGMVVSCAPTLKPDVAKDYYEDLTVLRPTIETENTVATDEPITPPDDPQHPALYTESVPDITFMLDSLLDSVALNNRKKEFIQGYTIQVYTGNSRVEANDVKAHVYRILPYSKPQVSYDLPNYKVKVGKFYHRLQAFKEYSTIKKKFPDAILVPQLFRIK